MKFIQPGAVRIESNAGSRAPADVAFRNPDGSVVLVVAHTESKPREIILTWRGRVLTTLLPARSVATFRWEGASGGGTRKPKPDAK
jgi:glucosylceramidase